MFANLKEKMLKLARHPNGSYFLGFFSFIEAIFFPIPVDIMLGPMAATNPSKANRLCAIVVITSLLGGMLTYSISYFAFDSLILPYLEASSHYAKYLELVQWFDEWGLWVFIFCSITFVPYKLIAIVAGVVDVNFITFFLISVTIRSIRFYLVANISKQSALRFKGK